MGISADAVTSFLKEATLMKDFDHPNVLSLVGIVYDQESMPMVVLPFMEHGDVKSLIRKDDQVKNRLSQIISDYLWQ